MNVITTIMQARQVSRDFLTYKSCQSLTLYILLEQL